MKICVIAPTVIPILGKNQKYGGIELVISLATEELVKRGHEVILFASADSKTSARLIPVAPKATGQGRSFQKEKDINHLAFKLAIDEKPDVIWDHTLAIHAQEKINEAVNFTLKREILLSKSSLIDTKNIPVIQTLHGPAKDHLPGVVRKLSKAGHFFVAISKHQAKAYSLDINPAQFLGTIHNAVDISHYSINPHKKGDYLLWVGRYNMEKGAHIAVEAAKKIDMPIKLIGKLKEKHEIRYFNKFVKPFLKPGDVVLKPLPTKKKAEFMSNAYATLMTNIWAEPFGLVALESMASGTTVIAPRKGSLPEILNGAGVLLNVADLDLNDEDKNFTEAHDQYAERVARAIKQVANFKPRQVRKRVEEKFTIKKNVDEYERIFKKAIRLKGIINKFKNFSNPKNYMLFEKNKSREKEL